MRFPEAMRAALADLEVDQLLRTPRVVGGDHGPEIEIDGRRVLDLCSNNYLGFANDPRIAAAVIVALQELGLGAPASRHISGTGTLHRAAEQRLADYVGLPSALLFSSGYAANAGAIGAAVGSDAVVFSDRLNHASLIDGCRLSRARILVYEHLDCDHLEQLLKEHRRSHATALVLTESLFSMDGDLAPLLELRSLCDRYEAGLAVDEAHAIGVVGPQGRGQCAAAGVKPDLLIGTLGKAFGCAGAFVAGELDTVRVIENRSRSHIFSTASPPALAAGIATATTLVAAADDRRLALAANAEKLRSGLDALGYRVHPGASAIIPIHVGDPGQTMRLSTALLAAGVFVHGIRPPTVPRGTSRLRVTPIATHSGAHLDRALAAFASLADHYAANR